MVMHSKPVVANHGALSHPSDATTPLSMPLYSTSGFDILSILSRIVNRPDPKVYLGPVDYTASFVVADTRRHDSPIVYCSPSFSRLTGYDEDEIIGRNCRFLQSPTGLLQPDDQRVNASTDPVSMYMLKSSLAADKEVQITLLNYRKGGQPFMNLLTIIPIRGGLHGLPHEEDTVIYHVGFQVDISCQQNRIIQKVATGSYNFDYSNPTLVSPPTQKDRKNASLLSNDAISNDLKQLLADPAFAAGFATLDRMAPDSPETNNALSLMLLDALPDFVLVVSLKGSFLYVAPAVSRVLGYEAQELIGKGIADICHPADVVPIMRQLKESSVTGGAALASEDANDTSANSSQPFTFQAKPRLVDLLFRARTISGDYVWMESRGRLYMEPGKGRKAIILSTRAREMSSLSWGAIAQNGATDPSPSIDNEPREFWGRMTTTGTVLFVGAAQLEMLGWDAEALVGKPLMEILGDESSVRSTAQELALVAGFDTRYPSVRLYVRMKRKDGDVVNVQLVIYRASATPNQSQFQSQSRLQSLPSMDQVKTKLFISPAPLIYQVRLADGVPTSHHNLAHPLSENVFCDLETDRSPTSPTVCPSGGTVSGTSWQYELQQLRFANSKLADEIKQLEHTMSRVPPPLYHNNNSANAPLHVGVSVPVSYTGHSGSLPPSDLWRYSGSVGPSTTSLKRSWHTMDSGPG